MWLTVAACGSPSPSPPSANSAALGQASAASAARTVTLITGDRVTLGAPGDAAVHVQPGPGREHVGFVTQRVGDQTMVIPRDVAELVVSERLDSNLFNITELLAQGYDDARRDDLPLIVTGQADGAGLQRTLATPGIAIERFMPALHSAAVRQRKDAASSIAAQLEAEPAQRVWLDRRFHPSLDRSVPQIGAPEAHARGFTGAGVVVAVLDTGVDSAHPDLAGKVADAQSFVDDDLGVGDVVGHGTHVASIIAGSGAASGGQFQGVAPDATLISGRVCDVFGCPFSAILAGMEWAVATKGARVINMSLGGADGAGLDPIEAAVNRLSADFGALFVVAAGNRGFGGASTVDSPSTADAALSVGAVDRDEQIAVFSSRGPRLGDAAVKPEVTAPGVGIVAARASTTLPGVGEPVGESYLRLSGTSMATPHVAGAAAILLQQHGDWAGPQLKAALIASANPSAALTAFEQGAGRIDLERATRQDVVAQPVTVGFGVAAFPHDDDPIVRRTVTYRNAGASPVTLAIAGSLGQRGAPADGMLTISPASITVPAGGTADVTLAVDTSGDRPDGPYDGELIANNDEVRVVTPLSVMREEDTLDLTVQALNTAGNSTTGFGTVLGGPVGFRFFRPPNPVRLPPGSYTISVLTFDEAILMIQPRLEFSGDTTITMDGRLSRPGEVSAPGQALAIQSIQAEYLDLARSISISGTGFSSFRSAQFGPAPAPGEVQSAATVEAVPSGSTDGSVIYVFGHRERNGWMTGFTEAATRDRTATVRASHRAAPDQIFAKRTLAVLADLGITMQQDVASVVHQGAFDRTEHYVGDGFAWTPVLNRLSENGDGELATTTIQGLVVPGYRAGRTHVERWNQAPFGPAFSDIVDETPRALRDGDELTISPTLFSEVSSPSRVGLSLGSQRMALFRAGELIGELVGDGGELFGPVDVPAARATYRFEAEATRAAEVSELSPRVTAAWTFTSGHTARPQVLALPTLRFAPALDGENRAVRALPLVLPVTIERPAGAKAPVVQRVTVDASFDDGATWSPVPGALVGAKFVGIVIHPRAASFVSLRGTARDAEGNAVEQTIVRAYKLK